MDVANTSCPGKIRSILKMSDAYIELEIAFSTRGTKSLKQRVNPTHCITKRFLNWNTRML